MRLALALSVLFAIPAFAHDHAAEHATEHAQAAPAIQPVQTTAEGAVYGAALPATLPATVSLDAIIADPAPRLGKVGAYSGRITEVCQKMGCWMVLATPKGDFVRVTMHEHAFGVPKDASGEAVVYGTLSEKTLTEAESTHLKQEGASVPAQRELRIDATSVLIRNAG